MPTYIVRPDQFRAEGAVVSWAVAARRLGIAELAANEPVPNVIELRWMLNAGLGLPTEPFGVWSRPHSAPISVALTLKHQLLMFAFGCDLLTWAQGQMSTISVNVQAPSGGTLFAFSGGPLFSNIVAVRTIPVGNSTVTISSQFIDCLLVTPGVTVTAAQGVPVGDYANLPGWTLVELVGLPVKLPQWAGVGKHGEPQGLRGAFTNAPTAAIARLKRGAPPIGWATMIAAGVPAPPWVAPNFPALIAEVNGGLLNYLHDIVKNFPPNQQAAQQVTVPLPAPKNALGESMNSPDSSTQLAPLPMTYMAASTDPFLSLALGFGTAYADVRSDFAATLAGGLAGHDFMITAHWEKGIDGVSAPADYAALIPAPVAALPPPAPANVATDILGMLQPLNSDGPWRSAVRTSWDRPPDLQLFRMASFAAARASIAPPQPAVALMELRASGGYRPIGFNSAADPPDPESWRVHAIDREVEIPSNPGTRQIKYGAAAQDLYGQWTPWSATDQTIQQPDLEPVRIASAKLVASVPAGGSVCPASIEIVFIWDWRIRSPQQITFVGRMYAAANHGDPPPSVLIPAGLDRSLAGGGAALTVTFAGDVPSAPGATLDPLTESGEALAAGFGATQGTSRRYRMTLSGLSLDFGNTGFIGLALWAQGQESIAPQRLSPWPENPAVISIGDPRPPLVPVFHVKLGSIPDAAGSSHVQISWTPQPNAAGYFIYEATEDGLLDAWGLPAPHPSDTLDARLLVLRNNFQNDPLRRPFTRFNSRALQTTSADLTLPKGSTGIHLYVVLGISTGLVESAWPSEPNPQDLLITVAAPHVTRPAPPMIEVAQFLDASGYKARLTITTRPGPRPSMVEVYRVRVDDAAREVDTMGPPITRLIASTGSWTVNSTSDPDYGSYITTVQGTDAPSGSWKRVWYRAAAWTKQDDTRGGLPGRSSPSNAAWVVLPPKDGPSISSLSLGGGPTLADILIEWTCNSPRQRTPLGPHRISVRAYLPGTSFLPGSTPAPLLSVDSTLDALSSTLPSSGSGVWVVATSAGVTTYRAIIRRAAVTDSVNFAVRITDPIGRTGAQLVTIPSGPVDPAPDLENVKLKHLLVPPPAHLLLTFSSSSPINAPLSGPYVLRITGVPIVPTFFPPPLTIALPLGSVPTKPPVGPPPASYILRSGAGPTYDYSMVTTAHLKGFVVRITAPDGRFVEKTV